VAWRASLIKISAKTVNPSHNISAKSVTKNRGIIRESEQTKDRRGTKLLELTELGQDCLAAWITTEDAWLLGPASDPMRTRTFAFMVIPVGKRQEVLRHWKLVTLERIQATQAQIARFQTAGDEVGAMATKGTELQLRARLKWIEDWLASGEGA
jgi:hypothetical protein